jgi:hypothetical protein
MDETRPYLPASSAPQDPAASPHAPHLDLPLLDALPLDGLIDEALAAYTACEPSPDFEARVLAAAAPLSAALPSVAARRPLTGRIVASTGWLAAAALLLICLRAERLQILIVPQQHPQQSSHSAAAAAPAIPPPTSPVATAPAQPAPVPARSTQLLTSDARPAAVFAPIAIQPIQFAPIRFGSHPQERP